MKKIFITLSIILMSIISVAQQYNMDNTSVTTCSGTFYDDGGTSDYTNSKDFIKTFSPSTAGNMLRFTFTSFSIETCCDYLRIYDGPNTSSPLIGTYTSSPGTITANNATGQLTFVWHSDGSVVYAGWVATISCVPPPANPCSSPTVITCGISANYSNSGTGSWYTSSSNPCGYYSEGVEKIYSYTPTVSGISNLVVTSATGGYIDYLYQTSTCASTGWTCIDDINTTGTYGSLSLTAGTTYYFLLDPEDVVAMSSTFNISCPCVTPSAPTAGTHTPGQYQIQWNWNSVAGATGYKYGTTSTYASATDNGASTTFTQTGLSCNTAYTLYVWAYNACGASTMLTLNSTTTACPAAPSNDNCSGAIALTPSSTCSYSTYSNVSATASVGPPAPGCASYVDDDVWFSVTVPPCGNLTFDTQTGGITDGGMAIYSGTCASLTLIECDDDDSPNGAMPMITSSTLTPGSTVYIRVWEYGGDVQGTFGICVLNNSPSCSGTPNAGTVTASVNPINCANPSSTLTGTGLSTGCGITYQWQSSPTGAAPWTNITGATNTTVTVSPVSNTYYRVVTTCSNGGGTNSSPALLINSSVTPPANDNCANAITLTVNSDLLCGNVTAGTTVCATNSGTAACVGSGADDDVWFKFTATSTVHNFQIINVSGSTDCVHEIFTGTCGSLTSVGCSDPETSQFTGFTIGTTYYLRVYTYYSGATYSSTFNVCVGTPPPPPSNDDPCGAIVLNVGYGSCTYQTAVLGTTTTTSVGIPAPGCASLGPDVWFKVIVPASGRLIVDMSANGGPTDMDMAWYTGTNCSNLTTTIECDDYDSQDGAMGMICRTGTLCTVPGDCQQNATLTPGTEVYIRVWEYGGGTFGAFDICAYEPQTPGAASTCASATTISALPYYENGQTTCCRANDVTLANANACASSYMDGEDYLYKYTPATNQMVDITLTGTLSYTGIFVTDKCPTSGGVNCVGSATSTSGNPTLCGISLTAGTTYYIMIDTDPTPNCTPFNISVTLAGGATCGLNYSVGSIAYAPDLNNGTDIALPVDDRFSSSYIPIGFPFCFDGYQYSQLLVSSNGYVIFSPISCASNLPTGNAAPGGTSEWSISEAIPNTTDAPRNSILFPWQDIYPSLGGTIKYQVLGTAPNRRFVLTYYQIPYYDCTSLLYTGQLKLFETTNNIEMHIGNKTVCGTWNGSDAIMGLHNYNGTQAIYPAGYNYPDNWTVTNSAWRYTCNCTTCIVPLPVTVSSFTGYCTGMAAVLNWVTTSEINFEKFYVERSTDAIHYDIVGEIPSAGSASGHNYEYITSNISNEITYYRLRCVDMDGTEEIHSNLVTIDCSNITVANPEIYPNPSNEGEPILVTGLFKTIRIHDILGRQVDVKIVNNYIIGLPSGAYLAYIDNKYTTLIIVR